MNAEQVKTDYPVIAENNCAFKLVQIQSIFKDINNKANMTLTDDAEIAYLDDLETFIQNTYCENITNIKLKKKQIERTQNFDISKVQNLPPDMVYEISTYLQPEIKYATQFTMLRSIQSRYSSVFEVEYMLLGNVPKNLLMDLVKRCMIYPSMNMRSKDQKERWCRMIIEEIQKYNYEKSQLRMDKLLALNSEEWSSNPNEKRIDKWYKFFLYIFVYKKHRVELESKVKKTDAKLTILKNKKIVVK